MRKFVLVILMLLMVSGCCQKRIVLDSCQQFTLEQYCKSIDVCSVDVDTSAYWDIYNKYGEIIYENVFDPEFTDNYDYITFFTQYGGKLYAVKLWNNELMLYKKATKCEHWGETKKY